MGDAGVAENAVHPLHTLLLVLVQEHAAKEVLAECQSAVLRDHLGIGRFVAHCVHHSDQIMRLGNAAQLVIINIRAQGYRLVPQKGGGQFN